MGRERREMGGERDRDRERDRKRREREMGREERGGMDEQRVRQERDIGERETSRLVTDKQITTAFVEVILGFLSEHDHDLREEISKWALKRFSSQ